MIQRVSSYLGVTPVDLDDLGVFDAFIGVDTLLFLDPFLLKGTKIPEFKHSEKRVHKYFEDIMRLIVASKAPGDKAWKEAYRRLIFKEMPGVSIGYGQKGRSGSGVGPKLARELIKSAQEVISMGIKDPEIFALLGLFEEDFGADRLSDMTIRIIHGEILAFTQRVSRDLGIKNVQQFRWYRKDWVLPIHNGRPLLFLPKELLRDLPVALSWDDIWKVASLNQELRDRLNEMIAKIWKGSRRAPKWYIKKVVLGDPENVKALVEAYKNSEAKPYDFDKDSGGQINWDVFGKKFATENPIALELVAKPTLDDVENVVLEIAKQFKRNIEVNGLKEHLYTKNGSDYKPLHERYSQLLFYSTADTYCAANDLDLSREPNAGNGPVDFKVSGGYETRVLAEIKLTSNKNLLAGLMEQLKAYEEAENTPRSVYVVIRVTESDNSIKQLQKLDAELKAEGKIVPKIIYVDARIKPSASKRKMRVR